MECGAVGCGHHYLATAHAGQGVQSRPNPGAGAATYAERNKRLSHALVEALGLRPGSSVVDFGAGVGHLAEAIVTALPSVRLTCVEADPEAAAWIRRRGLGNAETLAGVEPGLDAALMVEVIEHLDDPVRVLRQLGSKLRSEGRLFLSTPCGRTRLGSRKTNAYGTPEHVHFFTERSLVRALRAAGFERIAFRGDLPMYPRPAAGVALAVALLREVLKRAHAAVFGPRHLVVIAIKG